MNQFMNMPVKELKIVNDTRIVPESKRDNYGQSDIMDVAELKPTPLSKLQSMDLSDKIIYLCPHNPTDLETGIFYVYIE